MSVSDSPSNSPLANVTRDEALLGSGSLSARFLSVRRRTLDLIAPLSAEDCCVQSMADTSPAKWHLAHTTWFFETFLLKLDSAYKSFAPEFEFLFNSYYNTVGKQFHRPNRGMLTRPSLDRVLEYRRQIDERVCEVLAEHKLTDIVAETVVLGLHHEQQHQELLLTDIKHLLSLNPLLPAYSERTDPTNPVADSLALEPTNQETEGWYEFGEGTVEIGHSGDGFCFDNELPRHRRFLHAFSLSTSCVTNGEFLEFVRDGGYSRPEFWLSMGWSTVGKEGWQTPLHWVESDGEWQQFTLYGLEPLKSDAAVCHLSYFEADAFARWRGCRLPTEFEWETAATTLSHDALSLGGHLLASGVWQWTSSSYAAYPGYQPAVGAVGEYNGKFMCNQYVLRGGSCATPAGHIRSTYRNFFPPDARWQFSGIRLAKDAVHDG